VFALEVEYLLGRAFAGDFQDRSDRNGRRTPRGCSRRWQRPILRTAQAHARRKRWSGSNGKAHRSFMPGRRVYQRLRRHSCDQLSRRWSARVRGKQPRFFRLRALRKPRLFHLEEAIPEPEIAEALDRLAGRTAYLGKACSVVGMRAATRHRSRTMRRTRRETACCAYRARTARRTRLAIRCGPAGVAGGAGAV